MIEPPAEFARQITGILTRYLRQHGRSATDAEELQCVAERLWWLILRRGLPPPLSPGQAGIAGGIPEAECTELLRAVIDDLADALLAEATRQLIKTCFHPEFAVCRDSYRAATASGECRRQQLERTRNRVSGAHCVDCPYWVALDRGAHAALLRAAWHGDASVFDGAAEIFLPEDFRQLRRWLHAQARHPDFPNRGVGAS